MEVLENESIKEENSLKTAFWVKMCLSYLFELDFKKNFKFFSKNF